MGEGRQEVRSSHNTSLPPLHQVDSKDYKGLITTATTTTTKQQQNNNNNNNNNQQTIRFRLSSLISLFTI